MSRSAWLEDEGTWWAGARNGCFFVPVASRSRVAPRKFNATCWQSECSASRASRRTTGHSLGARSRATRGSEQVTEAVVVLGKPGSEGVGLVPAIRRSIPMLAFGVVGNEPMDLVFGLRRELDPK